MAKKALKKIDSLGKYGNADLKVDFDYLESEFGLRREFERLEKVLAQLVLMAVLVGLIAVTVWELVTKLYLLWLELHIVNNLAKLLVLLMLGAGAYSLYLLRDRDIFLDKLGQGSLDKLRKKLESGESPGELNITKYFDHDLIYTFDEVLAKKGSAPLADLLSELAKLPEVRNAIARLGLKGEQLLALVEQLRLVNKQLTQQELEQILQESFVVALENQFGKVDELAVFIYLCKNVLKQELLKSEVGENEVRALTLWAANLHKKRRYINLIKAKSALKPRSTVNRSYTSVFSPTLVKYSRDFTAEVVQGNFELSYAREGELQKLIESVTSGETSATLVLGQPGVGKTTFVKNLAVKMVVEDVPKVIQDMRLVGFDFNRAYALSANEQEFKASVQTVLEEVARAKNIILVIDDLDELTNIKQELSAEIVNLINDAMDVHKIRIIATASPEGYTKHIKPFKALDALFNKMTIEVPTDEIALQILFDFIPELEKQYRVHINFEAADKAVELSHRFAFERVLPDKAIDLINETISKALAEGQTVIDAELVNKLVAAKVGVEIGSISMQESEFLKKLEAELHKRVIGQHQAVDAVAAALRRSRAGLTNKNRPVASFLFFGPTGVGKTELAKTVAELYYGAEDKMIRLDMSEYQEEQNLQRLIGAEHVEEFSGGYLTEAVRAKPYSLILLDEIDKANPKVLDLFLQILDEGKIKDGMGREVIFTNTIIIATSNVASREIADLIAQGRRYSEVAEIVMPMLRRFLRIEFLNRFDKLIMFKPLLRMEVEQIANLLMQSEVKKLAEKGIKLEYSPLLLKELVNIGYNELYGARELRRVITDKVEDLIANLIIEKRIRSGNKLIIQNLNSYTIE